MTTFRYGSSTYSNAVRRPGETGFSGCFSASSTRVGQHVAVLLAQLDAPARQRVLVAAAGVDEHRRGARMVLLQLELGEAGIVAAPLGEAERRRMAGVAEEDGRELPVGPRHGQHRHGVIDRPVERLALGQQGRHVGLAVVAAIDGEGASVPSPICRLAGARFASASPTIATQLRLPSASVYSSTSLTCSASTG